MSEEQALWERQAGEPALWFRRFERYRLMEPIRSIAAVFQEEQGEKNGEKRREKPPGSWYEKTKEWRWEERAVAWDTFLDSQMEKKILAERKKVLHSRYALQHKRIETLDQIAQKLIDYLEDEKNVWLPDVKAIAGVPIDIVRFNASLLEQVREYLAEIAAETGDRVNKNDVTITAMPLPKMYINITEEDEGADRE